ncbi:unnamed protein product [Spirodela intermedia]|uniref:Uncharacterized protein n=1 Tax=Spirodela intermedia TaxID=51605 RepID=A0A7I8J655_SPIIN|nr:unnamed protein product [Spirodela intermedia]CAA6665524.1 unnamed protein product [Spirodela intermedia]
MGSTFPILLAISFLISAIAPSLSDPRISQAALVCGNRTADSRHRQAFVENFLSVLNSVTPQIASRRFAWASEGKTRNDSVFAFGECLKDLSRRDCDLCFATCKTLILRCLPFQMATRGEELPRRLLSQGSRIRYEDYDFSGEAVSPEDRTACGNVTSGGDHGAFAENALWLVGNLSSAAPENDGFFVGAVEKGDSRVYGLAQCWENVNRSSCRLCLKAAAKAVSSCVPMTEGRAMNSGCYMRYSSAKFYNNSGEDAAADSENSEWRGLAIVLAVVFSVVAAVMIVSSAAFFLRRRMIKRRLVRKQLGALAAAVNKSNLNFKYELLEKATNYFDNSNKLGQGGSGSVFKGVLADGKTVAVKRLVFNTRQWVDEFFNEVNLISGVHHKNLVGCWVAASPAPRASSSTNTSQQEPPPHLSDSRCAQNLSWAARYRIILGAAEGLIIHRDIKLSNILLDEHYNAKIADFGLARLIPDDKSHLSTGIAGTLLHGPEYLVRGKLTEKADVYSFGVVVIEIVCGKRKTPRAAPDPLSVLQTVWKLHTAGRLAEAVDPSLEGAFDAEEAVRVLQIGLLCAQASAELRPAMSAVVRMLRQGSPFRRRHSRRSSDRTRRGLLRASSSSAPSSSVNSITVSEVDPR